MSDHTSLSVRSRLGLPDMRDGLALEMQLLARRAAYPVAPGEIVKAQIRRAHIRLRVPFWRVREAWYGEAGGWSARAVEEMRARSRAICGAMNAPANTHEKAGQDELTELRRRLARLERLLASSEDGARAGTHLDRRAGGDRRRDRRDEDRAMAGRD